MITPKERKPDLSLLYVMCHHVLFCIATKYHQNVLKVIQLTECKAKQCQIYQREIMPKVRKGRVVILVCNMSSRPVLHFYQVSSKYSTEYLSYRADTKSMHNHCQILFYISTWYHPNILKGSPITEQTRNLFQTKGDNSKSKKARVGHSCM